MLEKCKTCKHSGYDEHGGYFYTDTCDNCNVKPRFSMYIKKKE